MKPWPLLVIHWTIYILYGLRMHFVRFKDLKTFYGSSVKKKKNWKKIKIKIKKLGVRMFIFMDLMKISQLKEQLYMLSYLFLLLFNNMFMLS